MQIDEAKQLLKEYFVPAHIIQHVEKVAKVTRLIGENCLKKGMDLDLESIICAALLHDLFRIIDISEDSYNEKVEMWSELRVKYKGKSHSEAAFEFLSEKGEHRIAEMVKKHDFKDILGDSFSLEEKILTYADKRVLHDKIVNLKERFDDGKKRYNPNNENLKWEKKIHDAYYVLEKELFKPLDIEPDDIK